MTTLSNLRKKYNGQVGRQESSAQRIGKLFGEVGGVGEFDEQVGRKCARVCACIRACVKFNSRSYTYYCLHS